MIQLENNKRVLKQWDLNQRVLIDDCEPGTRVEFSHSYRSGNDPLPVAAYEEDGHVYANIPNILLQTNGYIRVTTRPSADSRRVPQEKDIFVVGRVKPEDYEYTETELLQTADELASKMKADPTYAALLEEVKQLRDQCKKYAVLCNKILQDCQKIKKETEVDG